MGAENILEQLDNIDDLPTLPAIAGEVNRMLQDDKVSIKRLSETIEKDQSIVSKILRLVNSAFFGLRSEVDNISHAVTLLGFNTIQNVVISISIVKALSLKEKLEGLDITNFWRHSVAVAVTSRYLADESLLQSPDQCFIGGLLHDIGKIVLSYYFQNLFQKVWASARENNLSFYDAEKKEILVDHAQIGGRLAAKWQLPVSLVDAIRFHHVARKSPDALNLVMIVHAADVIVNSYDGASKSPLDFSRIRPEVIRAMSPQLESLSDWFPRLSTEMDQACKFFLEGISK